MFYLKMIVLIYWNDQTYRKFLDEYFINVITKK